MNRIAWVIAGAKVWQRSGNVQGFPTDEDFAGIDSLEGILNELLKAAGYSAIHGAGQNLIASELSAKPDRPLQIGWLDYWPFCFLPSSDSQEPVGLAVDVMRSVAQLLGVPITWSECRWGDFVNAVKERRVDLVCHTLMKLPRRRLHVRLSDPLPSLHVGMNVVVHKSNMPDITIDQEKGSVTNDLVINVVSGEIGETLHTFVAPKAEQPQHRAAFREACADLLEYPNARPIHSIVADHMICKSLTRDYNDLAVVFPHPKEPGVRLTIAAACHTDEPTLQMVIDDCIEILDKTGYFRAVLYQSEFGKMLLEEGVIDKDYLEKKPMLTEIPANSPEAEHSS